jgi:hypothetical protein
MITQRDRNTLQMNKTGNLQRNTEERSSNLRCRRQVISVTCSQCVSVAVVIQHAVRMSRVVWLFVPCLDLRYFST